MDHPVLRLVDIGAAELSRGGNTGVAAENQSAAAIHPSDARWVFATRVACELEGGQSAILRPERRRRLTAMATKIGLREFDANLLIAIVQDSVRTEGDPLSRTVERRAMMIREPSARKVDRWRMTILTALVMAAAIFMLLVAWIR